MAKPEGNAPRASLLPPRDLWLLDPEEQLLLTPTDDRGLVDVPAMITAVKECVEPSYDWTSNINMHHLYWPGTRYEITSPHALDPTNPHSFRNLPINRILVPETFHALLHRIMVPPPEPSSEVMFYRCEAWLVARELFRKARPVVILERQRRRQEIARTLPEFARERLISQEAILEASDNFGRLRDEMQPRIEKVPAEFRLVEPEISEPHELARIVGGFIIPKALRFQRAAA